MILKYTKVDLNTLNRWYIDTVNFERQLRELKKYKDGEDNNPFLLRRLTVRNETSFKDATFAINFQIDQLEAQPERRQIQIDNCQKEIRDIKAMPGWKLFASLHHPKKAIKYLRRMILSFFIT